MFVVVAFFLTVTAFWLPRFGYRVLVTAFWLPRFGRGAMHRASTKTPENATKQKNKKIIFKKTTITIPNLPFFIKFNNQTQSNN
jgi:hypothetical protein